MRPHSNSRSRIHIARWTLSIALALVVLPVLSGCASSARRSESPLAPLPKGNLDSTELGAQLEVAQREFDSELYWEAARRALALRDMRDVDPEQRDAAEAIVERAVRAGAERATQPKDLEHIRSRDLPRRARATQSIAKARLYLERGEEIRAYETILELENVHPEHPLRAEAGDIVYSAGIALAESKRRIMLLFKERARARGVLDYLVLEHPSHPRCDHAYYVLADLHARNKNLPLAIDRLWDLLYFHPDSPYALEAEFLIPSLRVANQERADYDRSNIERARDDLESWLARHGPNSEAPAPELEPEVRAKLRQVDRLLIEAKLGDAEFYAEINKGFGTRRGAEAALAHALAADLPELEQRARALLAAADAATNGGDPASVLPTPSENRDAELGPPTDPIQDATEPTP